MSSAFAAYANGVEMLSQRISRGKLAHLSRRKRKKLQVGEFTQWGCLIKAFSKDGQSAIAYLDDWADLVHGMGLQYGGLTSRRWMDVDVAGRGERTEVEAKFKALEMWLESRFRRVEMSLMYDVNDPVGAPIP